MDTLDPFQVVIWEMASSAKGAIHRGEVVEWIIEDKSQLALLSDMAARSDPEKAGNPSMKSAHEREVNLMHGPPPPQSLDTFEATKPFFIGVDSDGCAFDTMEVKHKECFAPNFIRHFDLDAADGHARRVWAFVNLYSRWRGTNRFPALIKAFELLDAWPEARRLVGAPPNLDPLRRWTERTGNLSNPPLEAYLKSDPDDFLLRVLRWSEAVNRSIEQRIKGIPPFPGVRDVLDKAAEKADIMVVSATPGEALRREWKEHGLDEQLAMIAGQEFGSKAEHLRVAAAPNYPPERILMIGDAPGDLAAARGVGAAFFPIVPGSEAACWARLRDEGLDRFWEGRYRKGYETSLIQEFESILPSEPPWAGNS